MGFGGNRQQTNVTDLVSGVGNVQAGNGTVADLVRNVAQMQGDGGGNGGSSGGKMGGFATPGPMFPMNPVPGPTMPFSTQPASFTGVRPAGNWSGGGLK